MLFVGSLFWEMYGINLLDVIKIKEAFPKGKIEKKMFLCKRNKVFENKRFVGIKKHDMFLLVGPSDWPRW